MRQVALDINMENRYIRFDWAAKRILRDKANFSILEGLVTVLLGEEVHIIELLESEGNQESAEDKFNRVDIKALNSKGEIIIVEIQQTRELHYMERILYGVAKAITEHISLGERYDKVKKVYSINILYFDLGSGKDYIYHGKTSFVGVNTKDTLRITAKEKDVIEMKTPSEIFPEYYLIRVNSFNKLAENHLEEWIRYFKYGEIKEDTSAPGLKEAKRKLDYLSLSKAEKNAYDEHLNAIMIQNDVLSTAQKEGWADGWADGRAKGRAEGRAEGLQEGLDKGKKEEKIETAKRLLKLQMDVPMISKVTGLSESEIGLIIEK